METIKVNMNPNPLDVQTIHASQNDGEARQWGFELHNNGELIDTSEVTEQMVFKSYKGGTEQLLPENTSAPTTSPFKGDIRYPQGLLTDQEFTYRQSPTEEDGLAKITDIKGNTLVWNQLIQNGNFESVSAWVNGGSSYTVSNGVATVKSTNASNRFGIYQRFQKKAQHKYFISFEMHSFGTIRVKRNRFSSVQETVTEGIYQRIETAQADVTLASAYQICFAEPVSDIDADYFTLKNYMIIDLTLMGLDSITSVDEFTSLFPLAYYEYNAGSLLSFNGTGIKTTGKNLLDKTKSETGGIDASGNYVAGVNLWRTTEFIPVEEGQAYSFTSFGEFAFLRIYYYDNAFNFVAPRIESGFKSSLTFTVPLGIKYIKWTLYNDNSIITQEIVNNARLQLSKGQSISEYEPYTSSTLSLPISTYFPNGMKSAGNVYDELTESKAITRIGMVDLGTIAWGYNTTWSSAPRFYSPANAIPTKIPGGNIIPNFRCVKYKAETSKNVGSSADYDKCISVNPDKRVYIQDSSFTDPVAFKESLSGVYLYYELATPTETSFTTASLVTENAEIPLSNEDGTLIGKCTEELSAEPGFHDAKIKLSDADGECYSNKIQLHVERSPQ